MIRENCAPRKFGTIRYWEVLIGGFHCVHCACMLCRYEYTKVCMVCEVTGYESIPISCVIFRLEIITTIHVHVFTTCEYMYIQLYLYNMPDMYMYIVGLSIHMSPCIIIYIAHVILYIHPCKKNHYYCTGCVTTTHCEYTNVVGQSIHTMRQYAYQHPHSPGFRMAAKPTTMHSPVIHCIYT